MTRQCLFYVYFKFRKCPAPSQRDLGGFQVKI